jgi:hypothetical protein
MGRLSELYGRQFSFSLSAEEGETGRSFPAMLIRGARSGQDFSS